jgi:hypothetical protein
VRCTHCGADNPDDSAFCRKCGRRLLSPRPTQVIDFEKLLNDGYASLDAGHTGEALLAAEGILRSDPANTSALALKSLVHERTGDLDQAIDALEQLVTLNPDSTPDRRRLLELRARRGYPTYRVQRPVTPTGSPLLAASLTAIVFLVCALAFTLIVFRDRPEQTQAGEMNGRPAATETSREYAQVPTTGQTPGVPPINHYRPEAAQQPATSQPVTVAPGASAPTGALLPPIVPIIGGEGSANNDTNIAGTTTQPAEPGGAVMPSPPSTDTRPPAPRSIIEVSVTPPSGSGSAPTGPSEDQESLNYLRIAQAQQQQADYAKAIQTYRKALPGARFPGRIYQAIALCHYRLGQMNDAAAAYEKAIQAYDAQARSGYDVNGAQAGIAACRAGLRAVRAGG